MFHYDFEWYLNICIHLYVYALQSKFHLLPISCNTVLLVPVFPSASVTVHMCTPASFEVRMGWRICLDVLLLAKQLLHVDDHWYVTVPVAP